MAEPRSTATPERDVEINAKRAEMHPTWIDARGTTTQARALPAGWARKIARNAAGKARNMARSAESQARNIARNAAGKARNIARSADSQARNIAGSAGN